MPRYSRVLGDVVKRALTRSLLGQLRFRPLADIPSDRGLITRPYNATFSPISLYQLVCFNVPHWDRRQLQSDVPYGVILQTAPSLVESGRRADSRKSVFVAWHGEGRASAPALCSTRP